MQTEPLQILLIENDDALAGRVVQFLGEMSTPATLTRATDLNACLLVLHQQKPDLILLDVDLPDSQGLDALMKILAVQPQSQLILLLGSDDKQLAERGIRAGAQDYCFREQLNREFFQHLMRYAGEFRQARRSLMDSEESYRTIFNAVNDAILVLGLQDDQILDFNQPTLDMFGHSRQEMLGMQVARLGTQPQSADGIPLVDHLQRAALGLPQIFEWQAVHKTGRTFWVEVNLKVASVSQEECLLAVVRDIDSRKRAEEEMLRLAAFPREHPHPIVECDGGGAPVYLNPAARAILEENDLTLEDLLPGNHQQIVKACLADGTRTTDVESQVKDMLFSWTYQPVPRIDVVHLYASDITDRRRAEERLQQNALEDVLTRLPNRALLMDRLERMVDLFQRHQDYHFAVLLLDLDRFKMVNDSLGHAAGDWLLIEVTDRLKSCVKQSDTVARIGGDEFVILLEDIGTPGNATRIAERIHHEINQPFFLGDREVFVGTSIGITISSPGIHQPAEYLRDAETAMYRSKAEGKGRYTVFDKAMQERVHQLLQLETDLRAAIERQEFLLFYQPILSIPTRRILGAEALIRWQQPGKGMISPALFIPVAEDTGLIDAIGEWVLCSACDQLHQWQQEGHRDLTVSVNLSWHQFRHEDLFERIQAVLQRSQVSPGSLKLEVTESVAARDAEFAVRVLDRLRDLGIQVMIDDFGTGYSSLSYLKRFPIDSLKVDRAFIRDIESDTGSEAIVTTVILMAHALGFEVVAEGVETEAQMEFLIRHRCDCAQGFLFSKPVPAPEFIKLVEQQRFAKQ